MDRNSGEGKGAVLILGANSDVAKAAIPLYLAKGYRVMAASRSLDPIREMIAARGLDATKVDLLYFDAVDIASHETFYQSLPAKPGIVVYAAGYLRSNEEAFADFSGARQMMNVHYCGAVSILNIIALDPENPHLQRIVGLSSLSGVRGRKSNFIYGSSKAAFSTYLAGLRQHLFSRKVRVNVIVAGYIRSKMTAHLDLPESLILEPEFIARAVVRAGRGFTVVPGFKWKMIYTILKILPQSLVARLP